MLVNGRIINHSTTPPPSGCCADIKGEERLELEILSEVLMLYVCIHSFIHQTFTEIFFMPVTILDTKNK